MDSTVAYLKPNSACSQCSAQNYLLAGSCSVQSVGAFEGIVEGKGPFRAGEYIFRAGQSSHALYVVREGAVKCERVTANGGVHVAGFYLSGELFGCEDIGAQQHSYDAVALEDSWVCEISITRLEGLFTSYPDLQHCFLARISERIRNSERTLTDSFHLRAKQRLVNFLCDFHTRLSRRNDLQGHAILLPMNKCDVASHLGISAETLSRLLRELEGEQKIRNGLRQIELLNPAMLACECSS